MPKSSWRFQPVFKKGKNRYSTFENFNFLHFQSGCEEKCSSDFATIYRRLKLQQILCKFEYKNETTYLYRHFGSWRLF